MSQNKKDRAAEKAAIRRKQNLNWGLGIAGVVAVIAAIGGTIIYSHTIAGGGPARNKKVIHIDSSWDRRMLGQGIPIIDIVKHCPSYIAAMEKTRREPAFDAAPILEKLNRSGKYSDYTLEALGSMYSLSGMGMEKIAALHDSVFFRQNGFKDVESHAAGKVIHMDDEQAFREIFNMSYFLGRSTFRARGNMETFDDNLEQKLWKEGGDCEIQSGIVFFNYSRYAGQCGKSHLKGRVRQVKGMDSMSRETGMGHIWLEIYMDNEWVPIDCNIEPHNRLMGEKFNPEKTYWQGAAVPKKFRQGFTRMIGWEYNPATDKFQEIVYVLPAEVEKEMRMHGWKP